jgi:hypothetical protein
VTAIGWLLPNGAWDSARAQANLALEIERSIRIIDSFPQN